MMDPCANFTGAPASTYDEDNDKLSEDKQAEVAGTDEKVKEADDPSETLSSTPARVTLKSPGHESSKPRS